jgi:cytochrome oxidase Cu insertion factor (SCO1/SenC/PrrC family)
MRLKVAVALAALALGISCARAGESGPGESAARTSPVQVGEVAPNFTLADQQNRKISLSQARGQTPVVMVFYRGHW